MKLLKPQHLALSLSLLGCSFSTHAQLMFSQYIDGSTNKKGLEIYNPDANTVNLADYEIQQFSNGDVTQTFAVNLQGSLKSKEKFVIGRQELKDVLGAKVKQVAGLSFNGDDAIVLLYKGTPIDRFGRVGEQPNNGWGSAGSKGKSFSRIETQNNQNAIDPKAVFNLDNSWKVWSDRNAFDQYVAGGSITSPVTNISCSTAETAIADLQTATQDQQYVVRGVITADYRYQDGFSGFLCANA